MTLNEFNDPFAGVLSKWTNYIHGRQNRYFALKDGNFLYFR